MLIKSIEERTEVGGGHSNVKCIFICQPLDVLHGGWNVNVNVSYWDLKCKY